MNNLAKKIFWGALGVTVLQTALFVASINVNKMCLGEVGGLLKLGCYGSSVVLFTLLLPAWGVWSMFSVNGPFVSYTLAILTIWVVNIVFTFLVSGGVLGFVQTIKYVTKKFKLRRK